MKVMLEKNNMKTYSHQMEEKKSSIYLM